MSAPIHIIIVDDHPIVRTGLCNLLQSQDDLEVIGMADSGKAALSLMQDARVDVVIMDYDLKGARGSDAILDIKAAFPQVRFLALTSYDEKSVIHSMVQAGAISYLLKDAEKEELLSAIRSTAQGQSWFSKDISRILLQDLMPASPASTSSDQDCDPESLTAREKDVLRLIVAEKTSKEIAESLFISPKTVENHRSTLMQKIGARNIAGLVKYALHHQLN